MSIVIVDYKLGNLFSVNQAFAALGHSCIVSSNPQDLIQAKAVVLPGVGAFKDAMSNLNAMQLTPALQQVIASGTPLLGICLGLQLLFTSSNEFGTTPGLNIIEGTVEKFPAINHNQTLRVPQIGWNKVNPTIPENQLQQTPLAGVLPKHYYYFVHSFYVKPTNPAVTLATTTYGGITYTSCVQQKNVFACQFHPEKSAQPGLSIYKTWLLQNGL